MTSTVLEIVRGGTTLDISDELDYVLEELDGLGMPPIIRYSEKGPQQDGVTDRGFTLGPRYVQLVIPILAADWTEQFANRKTLLNILRPLATPYIFKLTLPDGSVRQLDCHTESGPSLATREQIAGGPSIRAGFTVKAPDPTWYDPTAIAVTFQLGAASGGNMPVPTDVPTEIGGSTIDQSEAVNYIGSAPSYPTIRITGPITDTVMTNNTLGLVLDFTGTTVAGGDYYDIDLRYGEKSVVDSSGDDQLADLLNSSDIATWRIEADPVALSGINSINVAGTAATESTKVEMTYWTREIGV